MTPVDLFWRRCEGPIRYGVNDCCVTLADVIAAAGGPDLMAPYRGRYRTRLGFVRTFRRAGYATLPDAATAMLERHGRRVDEPGDFDVALVTYLDAGERVSSPAFFHSGFWCLRSERGGACVKARNLTVFRVIPCLKS